MRVMKCRITFMRQTGVDQFFTIPSDRKTIFSDTGPRMILKFTYSEVYGIIKPEIEL